MLSNTLTKRAFSFLPSLLLVGSLLGLAGCGSPATAVGGSSAALTVSFSVRIAVDRVQDGSENPAVTLTDARLAQQLYATIAALPPMPEGLACTLELGPHYTLTFQRDGETLMTALAKRDGCRSVTIAGESHDRKGTPAFWSQLDDAIHVATPPAHPVGLAIERTPDPAQASLTARIPSAEIARRLYDAILALKWLPSGPASCEDAPILEYQLVFQTADGAIPAVIHNACGAVDLQGGFQARGGWFVMDDQFRRLFQQIVGGAMFAPATPDHLALTVARMRVPSHQIVVADTDLMRSLYQDIFSLRPAQPELGCPSDADKLAGKGTWYTLSFSQWGLPLLQIDAYEGSCARIDFSLTQRVVQGDQTFWSLLHQAAGQK
ncbi:MAG TPA: hypothetical protein VFQ25_09960 [Ktedonobacterales bacterium]|nr:hypothetical protein [Ktedonobacterales bacterium]